MAKQTEIDWRELEDGTIEGANERYDFVISLMDEDDGVALDIFRAGVADDDEAYIETFQVESVDEAKSDAETYE